MKSYLLLLIRWIAYKMLSDKNILELQGETELIYPFYYNQLQPCSYDLRLAGDLKTIRGKTINLNDRDYTLKIGRAHV